jgi:hypothetical protein
VSGKLLIRMTGEGTGDQIVRVVVSNFAGSVLHNRVVKPGESEISFNPETNTVSFIQIYTQKRIYGEKMIPSRY